jgi:hypothetical protein
MQSLCESLAQAPASSGCTSRRRGPSPCQPFRAHCFAPVYELCRRSFVLRGRAASMLTVLQIGSTWLPLTPPAHAAAACATSAGVHPHCEPAAQTAGCGSASLHASIHTGALVNAHVSPCSFRTPVQSTVARLNADALRPNTWPVFNTSQPVYFLCKPAPCGPIATHTHSATPTGQ